MTSSLGITAFMATSYFDIKTNKLNSTLRRAIQKNSECQRAPKLLGGRNKAEKEIVP